MRHAILAGVREVDEGELAGAADELQLVVVVVVGAASAADSGGGNNRTLHLLEIVRIVVDDAVTISTNAVRLFDRLALHRFAIETIPPALHCRHRL